MADHGFDILWLDGRNLIPLPLMERRNVITGFDTRRLDGVRAELDEIEIVHSLIEWAAHGKLRHGRFLESHENKTARKVVRETP